MLAISPKPCSLNRALKAPMNYRFWRAGASLAQMFINTKWAGRGALGSQTQVERKQHLRHLAHAGKSTTTPFFEDRHTFCCDVRLHDDLGTSPGDVTSCGR